VGFAALMAAAVASTALALWFRGGDASGRALAVLGASAAAEAAAAALAWSHYRVTRDTSSLFLSAGFAVLALQTDLFAIAWPLWRSIDLPFDGTLVPLPEGLGTTDVAIAVYAWQMGWLVAAILFWLSAPRRDRRGRRPVRAAMVFGWTGATLIAVDLAVLLYPDAGARVPRGGFAVEAARWDFTTWGWGVSIATGVVLMGAAVRRWTLRGERASKPWLTAAFLFAIPIQIAVLGYRQAALPDGGRSDLLQFAVPTLAFVGLLLDQRSESSRMRRATDRAAGVMDGRAEIASMIAHEVRGPVATVRGIASTSLTHYDRLTEAEHREFLGMIELESRRLMTTVDQMSLALKIDAGSLRFDRKPQDLADIVRAGVAAVDVGERQVRVEAAPGLTVSADWGRMVEVVRQLVDNALKYSPTDTPVVALARREGADAVIEITDQGPGIPEADREGLFDKFPNWRPPGYEEQPGTGLGLFICRGTVAEHGGQIAIEDGPGGGTMLRVRLPAEG
jgi:signal transduction histidine kinase